MAIKFVNQETLVLLQKLDANNSVSESIVLAPILKYEVLTEETASTLLGELSSSINKLKIISETGRAPHGIFGKMKEFATTELWTLFGGDEHQQAHMLLSQTPNLESTETKLFQWNLMTVYREYKKYLYTLAKQDSLGLSDAAVLQLTKGIFNLELPENLVVEDVPQLTKTNLNVKLKSLFSPVQENPLKLGTKDGIFVARSIYSLPYIQDCFIEPASNYIRKGLNGQYEEEIVQKLNELKLKPWELVASMGVDRKNKVALLLNDVGQRRITNMLDKRALNKEAIAEVLANELIVQLANRYYPALRELEDVLLTSKKTLLQCDYEALRPEDFGLENFVGIETIEDVPLVQNTIVQRVLPPEGEYERSSS